VRQRLVAPALVALGGFIGAVTRYGVGTVLPDLSSTFVVNIVGCLALGYLLYAYRSDRASERFRILAATGFLSSLTTYSTFAHDVFVSPPFVALVYVAVSYGVGFGAVALGAYLAGERNRMGGETG